MPLYEYLCLDCNSLFDGLRPMTEADDPFECESCGSLNSSRMISVFNAQTSSGSGVGAAAGGCACGGACSCAG
jgi:putative FmdB family regulatory protein